LRLPKVIGLGLGAIPFLLSGVRTQRNHRKRDKWDELHDDSVYFVSEASQPDRIALEWGQ
jgi:hypothetical protein